MPEPQITLPPPPFAVVLMDADGNRVGEYTAATPFTMAGLKAAITRYLDALLDGQKPEEQWTPPVSVHFVHPHAALGSFSMS